MTERLLALFAVVAIVELVGASIVSKIGGPPGAMRVLHLAEMLLLIAFAFERFHLRDRVPRLILAGLALSFIGDLVISFGVSPLFAIPPAGAAHLCYIAAFVILIQNHAFDRLRGVNWWGELAVWPVAAVALWYVVIDRSAPLPLLVGSLVYAFIATLLAVVGLLLGRRLQRHAWLPAGGGVAFLVSDTVFGMFLLEGAQRPDSATQFIWVTYFLAQCLIAHAAALPRRQATFG